MMAFGFCMYFLKEISIRTWCDMNKKILFLFSEVSCRDASGHSTVHIIFLNISALAENKCTS